MYVSSQPGHIIICVRYMYSWIYILCSLGYIYFDIFLDFWTYPHYIYIIWVGVEIDLVLCGVCLLLITTSFWVMMEKNIFQISNWRVKCLFFLNPYVRMCFKYKKECTWRRLQCIPLILLLGHLSIHKTLFWDLFLWDQPRLETLNLTPTCTLILWTI